MYRYLCMWWCVCVCVCVYAWCVCVCVYVCQLSTISMHWSVRQNR